jgi:predicted DsbA family dithiol-disulfide isomerase
MRIDVWSDIVCPWCYIGHARLRSAIAMFSRENGSETGYPPIEVVHRSFELDPHAPKTITGTVLDMLASKYGMTHAQAAEAEGRVARLAHDEGLPFGGDRPHGNTLDLHRLLHHARVHGADEPLLDSMFRTNFGGQRSIFDSEVLVDLATAVGLEGGEVRDVLASDRYTGDVRDDEAAATRLGVRGVPHFVIDDRLAVSGAQSTQAFVDALRQASGTAPSG